MFKGQQIIPAISSHQDFKKFLNLPLEYGILMNFQLAQLEELIQEMKAHGKKVLIHSELIKGLATDEFGAIYLVQVLRVDGIISSKPKVIDLCKRRGVLGIMRFFLKDTISLKQSIQMAQKVNPDCLEVLPALDASLLEAIRQRLDCPLLFGGLLQTPEQIQACLDAGAIAVTTSNLKLWLSETN